MTGVGASRATIQLLISHRATNHPPPSDGHDANGLPTARTAASGRPTACIATSGRPTACMPHIGFIPLALPPVVSLLHARTRARAHAHTRTRTLSRAAFSDLPTAKPSGRLTAYTQAVFLPLRQGYKHVSGLPAAKPRGLPVAKPSDLLTAYTYAVFLPLGAATHLQPNQKAHWQQHR